MKHIIEIGTIIEHIKRASTYRVVGDVTVIVSSGIEDGKSASLVIGDGVMEPYTRAYLQRTEDPLRHPARLVIPVHFQTSWGVDPETRVRVLIYQSCTDTALPMFARPFCECTPDRFRVVQPVAGDAA